MSGEIPPLGGLSEAAATAVAREVAVHRRLLGTDSAATINRSHLAELAERCRRLTLDLEWMTEKAAEHERREDQFRNWWTGVKQQLDTLRRQTAVENEEGS